jgi:hypothetical protein
VRSPGGVGFQTILLTVVAPRAFRRSCPYLHFCFNNVMVSLSGPDAYSSFGERSCYICPMAHSHQSAVADNAPLAYSSTACRFLPSVAFWSPCLSAPKRKGQSLSPPPHPAVIDTLASPTEGVRRESRAFQWEIDPPQNWFAPPGSNRSGSGGDKAVGAFDVKSRLSGSVSM